MGVGARGKEFVYGGGGAGSMYDFPFPTDG